MGRATSNGNEANSMMKHASDMPTLRIETRVVVICDPTPYHLDHGGTPYSCWELLQLTLATKGHFVPKLDNGLH